MELFSETKIIAERDLEQFVLNAYLSIYPEKSSLGYKDLFEISLKSAEQGLFQVAKKSFFVALKSENIDKNLFLSTFDSLRSLIIKDAEADRSFVAKVFEQPSIINSKFYFDLISRQIFSKETSCWSCNG